MSFYRTPMQRFSFAVARRLPPWMLEHTWPVFIKGAAIIGGLSLFVPWLPRPVSLTNTLDFWESILWGIMLITGGVVGLWGVLRDKWLANMAGLIMVGAPLLVYGLAVYLYRGPGAFVNALLLVTLGLGSYVRALTIYVVNSAANQRAAIHQAHEAAHEAANHHLGEASAGPTGSDGSDSRPE